MTAVVPVAPQVLAILGRPHEAFAEPSHAARSLAVVRARRPLTATATVLPVVAERDDAAGRRWLRVMLPGRPNGSTGWIVADDTVASSTPWRITVRLRAREVVVRRAGRTVRRYRAVVGAPATPTPRGRFFVEESVRLGRTRVGSPFALALSARSTVLDQFDGGPGQIAIHGRGNVGGVLGTAASHGCVRLSTASITWLANRIGPGTPVTVER